MEKISKDTDSKEKLGTSNKMVFDTFKLTISNLIDATKNYLVYDMTNFINNIDRWILNQKSENTTKYKRGTIVFLDLGSQNFRYEPSYAHPCVVLVNRKNTILVVPSSSKKFGRGFADIIDVGKSNGFSKNTGIQSESFRWVHKNRVISIVGKVDNNVLNELDSRILKMIPTYKLEIKKLNTHINELEDKLKKLEAKSSEIDIKDTKE